ncbi:hypothetical protein E1286_04960 [Nonomuraea terrae]|uniref:Phosphoadenosine phosphosulphate reductase domain-containing protein n=1 Tax=Nonomuraea terrae TaxID=2530383 RepID=A0A4R4Z8L1_9ACTN|nr:hypothetical protein [Nonomuraea terrae]TDD54543.1 hypothetical protein E1286_04960 [Nonomuraea terrae]
MSAAIRTLSLGAGVQSTALVLLACEGRIKPFDAAIFADTGWEPQRVYDHLDRLTEYADAHGLPIVRVSTSNIRDDALDPAHRFVSLPTFTLGPCPTCIPHGHLGYVYDLPLPDYDGEGPSTYTGTCPKCRGTGEAQGMGRRQCTNEYKLKAVKRGTRDLLGYPHPQPIPRDVFADQAVGISRDEIGRAKDSGVNYLRSYFPLLDMPGAADGRTGWTRADCRRYLKAHGWGATPRSACVGCPFKGNREWREMRDNHPEEWADAVAFDHALRAVPREDGIREYLHASRVPLDEAPIDRVTGHEWRSRQTDVFGQIADARLENGDPDGCSPWACRSGEPVVAAEVPDGA